MSVSLALISLAANRSGSPDADARGPPGMGCREAETTNYDDLQQSKDRSEQGIFVGGSVIDQARAWFAEDRGWPRDYID